MNTPIFGIELSDKRLRVLVIVAGVLSSAFAGMLIVTELLLGLLLMVAIGGILLLSLGTRLAPVFLLSLGVVLTGYMFLGRGFAHIGVFPIFVSEMLLAITLAALVINIKRIRLGVTLALVLLLMMLGSLRTLPYLSEYGVDALRDAVIWGYGIFAVAAAWILTREHLERMTSWYRYLLPYFLIWVPVATFTVLIAGDLPSLPGTSVSILDVKPGDLAVHLTGAAAFMLLGLWSSNSTLTIREMLMWTIWFAGVVATASLNRGGMLAVTIGISVAMIIRPNRRIATMITAAVIAFFGFVVAEPMLEFGSYRQPTAGQIIENVQSIVMAADEQGAGGTAEWRMNWWNDIVDYTFNGQYFWSGRGFGINLATADGYQVHAGDALRAPHNGHLTILARMGVPGLVLWGLMNMVFGGMMLNGIVKGYRSGDWFWVQLLGWLLVYWIAMMINASFDVYLEGPQGGIWFWTVIGIGIAACRIQSSSETADEDSSGSKNCTMNTVNPQLSSVADTGNRRA